MLENLKLLKFFFQAFMRTFSSEFFHHLITAIALEKCKKGCNMLEIFLV